MVYLQKRMNGMNKDKFDFGLFKANLIYAHEAKDSYYWNNFLEFSLESFFDWVRFLKEDLERLEDENEALRQENKEILCERGKKEGSC